MCRIIPLTGFLLCIDSAQPDKYLSNTYQEILLENIFAQASEDGLTMISNGRPVNTICQWERLRKGCEFRCGKKSGILYYFRLKNLYERIGRLNLRAFPNSITELTIIGCHQKQEISTRTFPRKARILSFSFNKMFGIPELMSLPQTLQRLSLNNNRLLGPINLCFLPGGMVSLSLSNNKIHQDVLFYGNLPKNITGIYLTGNSIGGLYALSDSETVTNKHLFYKMGARKLH